MSEVYANKNRDELYFPAEDVTIKLSKNGVSRVIGVNWSDLIEVDLNEHNFKNRSGVFSHKILWGLDDGVYYVNNTDADMFIVKYEDYILRYIKEFCNGYNFENYVLCDAPIGDVIGHWHKLAIPGGVFSGGRAT